MPIGPRKRDDMFVSLPVVETDLDCSSSPTPNPLYITVEAPSKSALDRERVFYWPFRRSGSFKEGSDYGFVVAESRFHDLVGPLGHRYVFLF